MNKLVLFAALWLLAGCAGQTTIALLPEDGGRVGKVAVEAGGATQLLDAPLQSTRFDTKGGTPAAPTVLTEVAIRETWGSALAALPTTPVNYILYFESGTATLTAESAALIPTILAELSLRPFPHLEVTGHADATGSDALNLTLSRERAEVVAKRLAEGNLNQASVAISSHGKRNPLIPTPDGVAEPRNRRVTVTLQ
jgi:outer membrane protein OmpA-like peptidoglycan-associated protein